MMDIATAERRWLDNTDVVFFYFEQTNPSGLGSAFEVGYAVARGIPVIFVDEKQTSHSKWLAVHCNEVYSDLESGIRALAQFLARQADRSQSLGGPVS
jgi:nucleoside 2-deoxyribosyltransferase